MVIGGLGVAEEGQRVGRRLGRDVDHACGGGFAEQCALWPVQHLHAVKIDEVREGLRLVTHGDVIDDYEDAGLRSDTECKGTDTTDDYGAVGRVVARSYRQRWGKLRHIGKS